MPIYIIVNILLIAVAVAMNETAVDVTNLPTWTSCLALMDWQRFFLFLSLLWKFWKLDDFGDWEWFAALL